MPVNSQTCRDWARKLNDYKSGKANLENRVKDNQLWWRLMHSEVKRMPGDKLPDPTSAWLTNVILAKHAARMDAFPEATVLPRQLDDEPEAQSLSDIIPAVLDRCDFKETFSQIGWDKQISCCGVYFVGWNQNKYNGLGEIDIKPVDILNIFWEPGINDIQESKYVFVVKLEDKDLLKEKYPDLLGDGKAYKSKVITPTEYVYEDNINTDDKDAVVDVYYKRSINGRDVLHYAKFVQDTVLYATENMTQPITDAMGNVIGPPVSEKGLYDHGRFPFVFESVFPVKGSIAGIGYVDICKNPQRYIDIMGGAILKNVQDNATPRYFFRTDAGINKEQFNDLSKRIVECNGNLGEDAVRLIQTKGLDGNVLSYYQYKIDEMKQTAGNRDVNSGGTEGGVIAASAIAIMQESGNAISRDENDAAYRAYKEIILFCIELIRQFYTLPRFFRIEGERGIVNYVSYSNAKLQGIQTFGVNGEEYWRIPEFDLNVEAAVEPDYSKSSQNTLALQFYQSGFFNPENYIASVQCLDMMDFKGKEKMQQNMMAAAQIMMAQPQTTNKGGFEENTQKQYDPKAAAEKKQAQAQSKSEASVQP